MPVDLVASINQISGVEMHYLAPDTIGITFPGWFPRTDLAPKIRLYYNNIP